MRRKVEHSMQKVLHILEFVIALMTLGVLLAVGRGGERGFFTGMALAIFYMALGYGMAVTLGGNAFAVPDMLGEILVGAALGSAFGAVLSNLPPRRRTASGKSA